MERGITTQVTGFGYGQNKGTWKTYDNGKTWEYIADETLEQASIGGTTISKEDDGIYCTNADGTSKVFEDNNYKVFTFGDSFYLAKTDSDGNLNGGEFLTSKDGKIWELEINGRFSNINDKSGKCTGKDGIYELSNKKHYNDKFIEVDDSMNEEMLNVLFLYAINCIFLPAVSFKVTGSTLFDEGEYYDDDPRQQKFVIDGDEVYKYNEFSSLIDWQEDVGMFSFEGVTYKDLVDNERIITGDRTFRLNTDKKLNKAIAYVNAFYAKKKNELLMLTANKIKDIKPDGSFSDTIANFDYENETEKVNALETYSEYVLGAKGAAIEIYNKFLEATHYLDDYKAKIVIKAAVYETVRDIAPLVKGRIYDTYVESKKLGRKLRVDFSDISWDYNKALMTVYVRYQKYINRNMARFSEGGDKNIIKIAAVNYRTDIRDVYLDKLNKKLLNISLYDDLARHYSEKITELNNYLDGNTIEEPSLETPEDFKDFYLDRLLMRIVYIVNEFNPTFFEYDADYLELEEDEKRRAMEYAKEIFSMFKLRICDYFSFLRNKDYLNFKIDNAIKTDFQLWKSGNSEKKPSWEEELKRLDVLARDSIVYIFISEEHRI